MLAAGYNMRAAG